MLRVGRRVSTVRSRSKSIDVSFSFVSVVQASLRRGGDVAGTPVPSAMEVELVNVSFAFIGNVETKLCWY